MCMCVSDRERGQKPLFSIFNQKLALAVPQALLQGQTCLLPGPLGSSWGSQLEQQPPAPFFKIVFKT